MGTPDLNLIPVEDLEDPRVAVFRCQRDQWLRARHRHWMDGADAPPDATATGLDPAIDPGGDLFMAEGDKVAAQLFGSPHETVGVLVCASRLDIHRELLARAPAGTPIYAAPKAHIEELTGFAIHRGLMALGRRRDPGPLPELLARSACCVICEDLANHDNVGGVFRAVRALAPRAEGFAWPACVLLSPRCCDPLYRKALRVSMGNALHVPFARLEPWPGGLDVVSEAGFGIVALHPGELAVDIRSLNVSRPAIVLGTEGPGLSGDCLGAVERSAGKSARIPIESDADSLNVSVACAVALHVLRPW